MGRKLHYKRRRIFYKKKKIAPVITWGLLSVVIVAAGFFGAKYFSEHPISPGLSDTSESAPADSATTESSVPVSSDPSDISDASADTPAVTDNVITDGAGSLHGFYLPFAQIKDENRFLQTLNAAKSAGCNSVIMELKNADGVLYYRSGNDSAVKVNSFAESALSVEELKARFSLARNCGIQPIAHLYAFRDNAAARALPGARITPTGNKGWVWYDNAPGNGGKAWLNPYANEAHMYIIDLARELRDCGASAIMLDGVQFPKQTSSADFGAPIKSLPGRDEALTAFIKEARTLLGNSCPIILASTQKSATGEDTAIYGNNPLTFAPSVAAPAVDAAHLKPAADETQPDPLQALIRQMIARINVIPEAEQPGLAPCLQVENLSGAQIRQQIDACSAAGTDFYILYAASGRYDFAAIAS